MSLYLYNEKQLMVNFLHNLCHEADIGGPNGRPTGGQTTGCLSTCHFDHRAPENLASVFTPNKTMVKGSQNTKLNVAT
ncbi:hypothetical protein T07_6697 [Trichinella nelsoni]|uniref:Uncharacterized protein n=1 Tax=Trichinella nelsoni TaxID=6336 RepID=A0A0V0RX45_9BILA|nr:hypothetical protein T07_6697 [Trichinella nelsoni]